MVGIRYHSCLMSELAAPFDRPGEDLSRRIARQQIGPNTPYRGGVLCLRVGTE